MQEIVGPAPWGGIAFRAILECTSPPSHAPPYILSPISYPVNLLGIEQRFRYNLQGISLQAVMETAAPSGVAGGFSDLFHFEQDTVTVAVQENFFHDLFTAGTFALPPEFSAASRPVNRPSSIRRRVPGLLIHPGQHQHFTGSGILGNGG